MGVPIVETGVYDASCPSVANGEFADGNEFTAPLQVLADRTGYLKGLLDAGVPIVRHGPLFALPGVTGMGAGDLYLANGVALYFFNPGSVQTADGTYVVAPAAGPGRWVAMGSSGWSAAANKLRQLADLAALAGLTGMLNGELAVVPGLGLYVYVAAGAETAAPPFIVAPTSGGGRWYSALYSSMIFNGGASGTAARFATPVPNALVTLGRTVNFAGSAVVATGGGAWDTSVYLSNAVAVQSGDQIDVDATFSLGVGGPGGGVVARLAAFDGVATTPLPESSVAFNPNSSVNTPGAAPFCLRALYTAPADLAALQFKVQVQGAAGASLGFSAPVQILLRVIRP